MPINVYLPVEENGERVELTVEESRVISAVSPTATVERTEGGAKLTVHDLNGTTEAVLYDGQKGDQGDTGPRGATGPRGETGPAGADGFTPTVFPTKEGDRTTRLWITNRSGTIQTDILDGFSPIAAVEKSGSTATVTVTDENGTTTAQIYDGAPGQDGVSPTVAVTDITGGHRVSVTDAEGTESFDVMDGADGQPGADGSDGVSPTVTVTDITGGHRVAVTDAAGTQTFDVMDGGNGPVVRYDEAQALTAAEKATARANIGAARDVLEDEVRALHGLISYAPQDGTVSGTNYATITRTGDIININGTHGGGTAPARLVLNGEFAYANSATAFAGLEHAGLVLTVGHKYALKLSYISGTASRLSDTPADFCWPAVHINSTDNPPIYPADGTFIAGADGRSGEYRFTYDSSITDGVLLTLILKRSSGGVPTFNNYKFAVTLEEVNDSEVTVSGTTATITARSGVRYLCGTLTELSFTPSASGLCEVVFTSGTTPTVLTLPQTVVMPDWWTGVEASRTYSLMIEDGTRGVVTSWAT